MFTKIWVYFGGFGTKPDSFIEEFTIAPLQHHWWFHHDVTISAMTPHQMELDVSPVGWCSERSRHRIPKFLNIQLAKNLQTEMRLQNSKWLKPVLGAMIHLWVHTLSTIKLLFLPHFIQTTTWWDKCACHKWSFSTFFLIMFTKLVLHTSTVPPSLFLCLQTWNNFFLGCVLHSTCVVLIGGPKSK